MKGADRMILLVLPLLALGIAFWFLFIAPKRSESGDLQDQITSLEERIDSANAQIASSELARDNFSKNYGTLVSLGRAVPENESEQATLIFDLAGLSKQNKLNFRNFQVTDAAGAAGEAAPPPTQTPAEQSEERADTAGQDPQPVGVTTEAIASTLPIGAVVGPAGLPVMPYDFSFLGNFFDMATFFGDIDDNVIYERKKGKVNVDGRLMTINGFALTGDQFTGFPNVEANFSVTTYLVPPGQGLQAGATPAGPAPVSAADPATVANTGTTP